MAIVDIKPTWRNEGSDATVDINGDNRQRSARFGYTILVDSPETDDARTVHEEAHEVYGYQPQTVHPEDPGLICTSIRVSRLSPIFFTLEAQFGGRGIEPGENPLDEPADVDVDYATTAAEFDQDINGNAIANANGEGYTVTDEVSDMVLVVRRNLAAFDYLLGWQYMHRGATNSDVFLGFPPGTARLRGLNAKKVDSDLLIYWSVTARVAFRSPPPGSEDATKAWYARARHEGFLIRDPFDPLEDAKHALDGEGKEVSKPVLLSLADGTRILDPADAEWQEWQMAPSLPFSALGFF